MSRARFWILGVLLFIYIAGVLLLSAITLHEPKNNGFFKVADQNTQATNPRSVEFPNPGFRPPFRRIRIQWCADLRYIEPPGKIVALASFPGSGNTWLRYLLQQATGYLTGSIYKDYGLLKNGFPAENVSNGSVLVVKTHEWGPLARKQFSKALLLVRSPAAAIQAEFNRQSGGHVGFASPDRYKRTRGRYWQQFVTDKLLAWKQTNLDWLYNFTGPTHVIFYEQLVENVEHTLRSVIEFLGIQVDEELFRCAIERQEGIYRRKKRVLTFDPYTPAMKQQIQLEQERVYESIYRVALPAGQKR